MNRKLEVNSWVDWCTICIHSSKSNIKIQIFLVPLFHSNIVYCHVLSEFVSKTEFVCVRTIDIFSKQNFVLTIIPRRITAHKAGKQNNLRTYKWWNVLFIYRNNAYAYQFFLNNFTSNTLANNFRRDCDVNNTVSRSCLNATHFLFAIRNSPI